MLYSGLITLTIMTEKDLILNTLQQQLGESPIELKIPNSPLTELQLALVKMKERTLFMEDSISIDSCTKQKKSKMELNSRELLPMEKTIIQVKFISL